MHESLLADPRFWVAVSFLLFFVIFGKRLVSAVLSLLDGHTATVRARLDEAARLRNEAEAMLADAQARRATAETEAVALVENAQRQAMRVAESARAEAAAAATRRERMALDRIAAAEKAAVTEVRQAAVDVATEAAAKVMARGLPTDADAALIDRAIAGLPAALSGRRAA